MFLFAVGNHGELNLQFDFRELPHSRSELAGKGRGGVQDSHGAGDLAGLGTLPSLCLSFGVLLGRDGRRRKESALASHFAFSSPLSQVTWIPFPALPDHS